MSGQSMVELAWCEAGLPAVMSFHPNAVQVVCTAMDMVQSLDDVDLAEWSIVGTDITFDAGHTRRVRIPYADVMKAIEDARDDA